MFKVLCCCKPTRIGQSQITEICLEKQNHQPINGGMNLYSTNGTHYLLDVAGSESYLIKNFALKDRDKLLGINYEATECFSHNKVLDMLRNIVSSQVDNSINLVIERQNENDQTIIVEIYIDVTETSEEYKPITTVGSFAVKIRSYRCIISEAFSNRLVTADEKRQRVYLQPGQDQTKDQSIFICNEYVGISVGGIFKIVAFKCTTSDYYIEARKTDKTSKLDLVGNDRPPRDDQQDARFFFPTTTDKGFVMFESLLFRGRYWTSMAPTNSTQLPSSSAEDSLQLQKYAQPKGNENQWFTILPGPFGKDQ